MDHFFPRIQVQTCAQMHTRVKLLERIQMKTIFKLLGGIPSNYWGGYIQRWALHKIVRKFRKLCKLRSCAICVAHYAFFRSCAVCVELYTYFFSACAIRVALYAFFFSACTICVCESVNRIFVAL